MQKKLSRRLRRPQQRRRSSALEHLSERKREINTEREKEREDCQFVEGSKPGRTATPAFSTPSKDLMALAREEPPKLSNVGTLCVLTCARAFMRSMIHPRALLFRNKKLEVVFRGFFPLTPVPHTERSYHRFSTKVSPVNLP